MAAAKAKFTGKTIANIKKNLEAGRLKETDKDGAVKSYGKFYSYEGLDKIAAMTASELKAEENTTDVDVKLEDLKKKYRGAEIDVDRKWISENVDKIVNLAFEFKFTKKSVVSAYNEVKKGFDAEIKTVKVGPADLKVKTEHARAAVKTLNKIASAATQLFIERQAKALGILTKVAVGTMGKSQAEKDVAKEDKEAKKAAKAAEKEEKKENKTEEVKESAIVGSSYTSEIEKLFDWNF